MSIRSRVVTVMVRDVGCWEGLGVSKSKIVVERFSGTLCLTIAKLVKCSRPHNCMKLYIEYTRTSLHHQQL